MGRMEHMIHTLRRIIGFLGLMLLMCVPPALAVELPFFTRSGTLFPPAESSRSSLIEPPGEWYFEGIWAENEVALSVSEALQGDLRKIVAVACQKFSDQIEMEIGAFEKRLTTEKADVAELIRELNETYRKKLIPECLENLEKDLAAAARTYTSDGARTLEWGFWLDGILIGNHGGAAVRWLPSSGGNTSLDEVQGFLPAGMEVPAGGFHWLVRFPLLLQPFYTIDISRNIAFQAVLYLPRKLDAAVLSKLYGQLLGKVDDERQKLLRNLQKIDEEIIRLTSGRSKAGMEREMEKRAAAVEREAASFRSAVLKAWQSILNQGLKKETKANGKANGNGFGVDERREKSPQLLEPGGLFVRYFPGIQRNVPVLGPVVEALRKAEFSAQYGEIRRLHTQATGGLANALGTLRDMIKPEENAASVEDLYQRKNVRKFSQAGFRIAGDYRRKTTDLLGSVRDLLTVVMQIQLNDERGGDNKLSPRDREAWSTVSENLARLHRFLVLYRQGLGNFFAIEWLARKGLIAKDSERPSGAFAGVFLPLVGVAAQECGDSRGNHPDFLKRMGVFSPQGFDASLKKLETK